MKKFFRDKAYKAIRGNEPRPEWPDWLRLLFVIGVLGFIALVLWQSRPLP